MLGKNLLKAAAGLLGGVLALALGVLALGYLYAWSENRNFEKMREKSKLDCEVMRLHCLVDAGDLAEIRTLLESGQGLEARDGWGRTALFFALMQDKTEIGELLVAHGANPNTQDETGRSVFREAVRIGRFAFADKLIAAGADMDAIDHIKSRRTANPDSRLEHSYSNTAIENCIQYRKLECVSYLIENGADLDVKDSHGLTARERIEAHSEFKLRLQPVSK